MAERLDKPSSRYVVRARVLLSFFFAITVCLSERGCYPGPFSSLIFCTRLPDHIFVHDLTCMSCSACFIDTVSTGNSWRLHIIRASSQRHSGEVWSGRTETQSQGHHRRGRWRLNEQNAHRNGRPRIGHVVRELNRENFHFTSEDSTFSEKRKEIAQAQWDTSKDPCLFLIFLNFIIISGLCNL